MKAEVAVLGSPPQISADGVCGRKATLKQTKQNKKSEKAVDTFLQLQTTRSNRVTGADYHRQCGGGVWIFPRCSGHSPGSQNFVSLLV